jgi:hypothetical protein
MGPHTDRATRTQEAELTGKAINAFMDTVAAGIARTTVIPAEKKDDLLATCNQAVVGIGFFGGRSQKFPAFEKLPTTLTELKDAAHIAHSHGIMPGGPDLEAYEKQNATYKTILDKALRAAEKAMPQGVPFP